VTRILSPQSVPAGPSDKVSIAKLNDFKITLKRNSALKFPFSLKVSRSGIIHVLDRNAGKIRAYSPQGETVGHLSEMNGDRKLFSEPIDFAIDQDDNFFILDKEKKGTYSLIKIDRDAKVLDSMPLQFKPSQVVTHGKDILISDNSLSGTFLVYNYFIGSRATQGIANIIKTEDEATRFLQNVSLVSIAPSGNIYLANRFLPKVRVFSRDGAPMGEFSYSVQAKNKKPFFVPYRVKKTDDVRGLDFGFTRLKPDKSPDPICYGISVDHHGNIYLLVRADYAVPEACSLYCLNSRGDLEQIIKLPFRCLEMCVDQQDNLLFGSAATKSITRYSVERASTSDGKASSEGAPAGRTQDLDIERLLETALKSSAQYYRKLEQAAFNFVCEERVFEQRNLYPRESRFPDIENTADIKMSETNRFLYDYQLIRENNKVLEKRTLLEENGTKKNVPNAELKTRSFSYEKLVFGPRMLSEYWQTYHDYYLVASQIEKGIGDLMIIEVLPKVPVHPQAFKGRVWVRKSDFALLRIEKDPSALPGYGLIEDRGLKSAGDPDVTVVIEYGVEKNGIRFASCLSIEEAYKGIDGRKVVVSTVRVNYMKYKFFTVETETRIKNS
ncbi:MAG: hypothetical protein IMZ47_06085, partial [Firmicutes bacterium]|nr:hypothetical protein [Bacillota bacterium]